MLDIAIQRNRQDVDSNILSTDLDENIGDFSFVNESKGETFQVSINVRYFRPEEVTVKVLQDRFITVECIQQKKKDEEGYISRHFIGKMYIPEEYDIDKLLAKLSPLGMIILTCPKKTKTTNMSRSVKLKNKL